MDASVMVLLGADIAAQRQTIDRVFEMRLQRAQDFSPKKIGKMESIAYQLHNFYGGIEELLKVIATHCENNIATRSLIMESTDQSKALRFQFHQRLEAVYREICDEVAAANLPDGEIARLAQLVLRSRHEGLRLLVKAEEMDEYYALYPEAEEDAVG